MTQARVSWVQFAIPDPQPMGFGCPPGSLWHTFPPTPALGSPYVCTTCAQSGRSPSPITPAIYRLRTSLCLPRANPFAPPGTDPSFGNPVLDQVTALIERWWQQVQPYVPGAQSGPVQLNPANGNLVLRLMPPRAGAFDPTAVLVYNSQTPQNSEFGWGWSLVPKHTVTSLTGSSVCLQEGTGTARRYSGRDPTTNYYQGPGGHNDALQFNPADGTWTQTQPDGFQVHYNAVGRADYLTAALGQRWPLTYIPTTDLLSTITDPFSRRTTLIYNGCQPTHAHPAARRPDHYADHRRFGEPGGLRLPGQQPGDVELTTASTG